MDKIKRMFSILLKKIELKRINFLNHKFKKYIVKFEEDKNKLKIYNSNGDYKVVENSILNKVKCMDIIKLHQKEIEEKINYYDNLKDDYKIVIIASLVITIFLAFFFMFSFFLGNLPLLIIVSLIYIISFICTFTYIYNICLFREEVKRLKCIMENKNYYDDDELITLMKDTFTYIKGAISNLYLKSINFIDKKSKI